MLTGVVMDVVVCFSGSTSGLGDSFLHLLSVLPAEGSQLRSGPGITLDGKKLPSPRLWSLPQDSPHLQQCNGKEYKGPGLSPQLINSDEPSQLQGPCENSYYSCYDDIPVHLPALSNPAFLSSPQCSS